MKTRFFANKTGITQLILAPLRLHFTRITIIVWTNRHRPQMWILLNFYSPHVVIFQFSMKTRCYAYKTGFSQLILAPLRYNFTGITIIVWTSRRRSQMWILLNFNSRHVIILQLSIKTRCYAYKTGIGQLILAPLRYNFTGITIIVWTNRRRSQMWILLNFYSPHIVIFQFSMKTRFYAYKPELLS